MLHTDLWGPSFVKSVNGFAYFMLIVDDFSQFCWIYFLTTKSQATIHFLQFQNLVTAQFSAVLHFVRSDWGGEFHPLRTCLSSVGIQHQLFSPHTPQQNDQVERKNRQVVEVGLSISHGPCPHSSVILAGCI